jgi:hypothetical protein
MTRKGDWMQTMSGRQFWPLDARPDEIDIVDIAHALSNQCRYAGHVSRFYSVAEHCVLIAEWLTDQAGQADFVGLMGLLHDAGEAYLVDLPRPIKHQMPAYRDAERRLWGVVAERFRLPSHLPDIVHEADNRILNDERAELMRASEEAWNLADLRPLGVRVRGLEPRQARGAFIAAFSRLGGVA